MKNRAIGLLINGIDSNFNNKVWQGASDSANSRNFNLVSYSGGLIIFNAEKNEISRNMIYENVDLEQLEGLVLAGTSIANNISSQAYAMFCSRYKSRPIVSIGDGPDHVYKCLVDNKSGLLNLVDHLVKGHGCRKFAFLSGPKLSSESNIRFEAFKKALDDNGIKFNEELFYVANFIGLQARQAIHYFIKEKKLDFDAVVAANDDMALTAAVALQELGYDIPGDIKVAGFDDVPNASVSNPPLSTVRQPIYNMAVKAVKMLADVIEGKNVPRVEYLPTSMVIRESCGCTPGKSGRKNYSIDFRKEFDIGQKEKAAIRDAVIGQMKDVIDDKKIALIGEMIEQFVKGLAGDEKETYAKKVSTVLDSIGDSNDIQIWNEILSCLEKNFANYITEAKLNIYAELVDAQKKIFDETIKKSLSMRYERLDLENRYLRFINRGLGFINEIGAIHEYMPKNLKTLLKISSCYITAFEDDKCERSKLIAGYDENGKIDLEANSEPFPARRMLPGKDDRLKMSSYVVYPVHFDDRSVGIIIMGVGTNTSYIYESVAYQLASSIWGAYMRKASAETARVLESRNKQIDSLVKPMIDLIRQVASISADKMKSTSFLGDMTRISYSKISETAELIRGMSAHFNKMNEITNIINSISETVNIVSINASIESAHAGQYGKGFLVIAKEIKKLAGSTKDNSEQISRTLKKVMESINNSIAASSESILTFSEQEKVVFGILDSLKQISENMERLTASSREILALMDEK